MEIVINGCYGGYGLSPLAVEALAKRKGKECYWFRSKTLENNYTPITLEQAEKEFVPHAFSVPNPNEYLKADKDWHDMTLEERKAHNKRYEEIDLSSRPDDRTDKDLIAVVKKLGKKANGSHAELRVITIPDGTDWELDEYDGIESVHEVHQSWS